MERNPHILKWKFQKKRRRISVQKEDQVKRENQKWRINSHIGTYFQNILYINNHMQKKFLHNSLLRLVGWLIRCVPKKNENPLWNMGHFTRDLKKSSLLEIRNVLTFRAWGWLSAVKTKMAAHTHSPGGSTIITLKEKQRSSG